MQSVRTMLDVTILWVTTREDSSQLISMPQVNLINSFISDVSILSPPLAPHAKRRDDILYPHHTKGQERHSHPLTASLDLCLALPRSHNALLPMAPAVIPHPLLVGLESLNLLLGYERGAQLLLVDKIMPSCCNRQWRYRSR